jgi:Flp pilus assembly protein TadG
MAFILPVFLSIVFSLIEYGHAQMVSNLLKCACRNAARQGSTEGVSTADAQDIVREYLQTAINTSTLNVIVKDAGVWDTSGSLPSTNSQFNSLPNIELSSADARHLFLVRATINYSDVSLMSLPFLNGITLSGQAFMRHE